LYKGAPYFFPITKETEDVEEMKQQGEEKDVQISESHHGIFLEVVDSTAKYLSCCSIMVPICS
jgi:hypothetical protein